MSFRHLPNTENLAMINKWTDEGKMSSKEISQALEVQEDAVKRFMEARKKETAKANKDAEAAEKAKKDAEKKAAEDAEKAKKDAEKKAAEDAEKAEKAKAKKGGDE